MTSVERLLAGADRVQFGGWTQGASARDAQGKPVPPWSPRAIAWCGQGAIRTDAAWDWGAARALDDAVRAEKGDTISQYNDTVGRTAGEVADMLRRAAKLAAELLGRQQ